MLSAKCLPVGGIDLPSGVAIGFMNVPDITPDTAVHVPEPKRIGCTLISRSGAKTNSAFRSSMCLSMPLVSCPSGQVTRSEEHTSELQSHSDLVCRLLLEKKKQHDPT